MNPTQNDISDEETISNLLSVPMEFILSRTKQQPSKQNTASSRKRKLLHGEATCLLQVRFLASEIDLLLNIASEILGKRIKCREYSEKVASLVCTSEGKRKRLKSAHQVTSNNHHLSQTSLMKLRSILPILHTYGDHSCLSRLSHVESEIRRCLTELQNCGEALQQFSEQNLSVAEQLSEMFDVDADSSRKGNALANEKMIVGEIEETICARINSLIRMSLPIQSFQSEHSDGNLLQDKNGNDGMNSLCNTPNNTNLERDSLDVFETEKDPDTKNFISMKLLCFRLENSNYNDDETENVEQKEDKGEQVNDATIQNEISLKSVEADNLSNLQQIAQAIDAEDDEHEVLHEREKISVEPINQITTNSIDVAATTLSELRKKT